VNHCHRRRRLRRTQEETCALLKHDGCAFADAATAAELGGVSGKVEVAYDPDGYAVKLIAKGAEL
jgi:hypothetical protein